MKKLFTLFLLINSVLFIQSNPFYNIDSYPACGQSYIFLPGKAVFSNSYSGYFTDLSCYRSDFTFFASVGLSRMLNFDSTLTLSDYSGFKNLMLRIHLIPVDFFKLSTSFTINGFYHYSIAEYHLTLTGSFFYNSNKYIYFGFTTGLDFNFIDYNTNDILNEYKTDLYLQVIFLWNIHIIVNPTNSISVEISAGNYDFIDIYSVNYLFLNTNIYYHFKYDVSIYSGFMIDSTGALPFAAAIHSIGFTTGIRYELKI